MISRLFFQARQQRRQSRRAAADVYVGVVEQARRPEFYTVAGVPDTIDGRFDMIVLNAFLVLDRLQQNQEETEGFAQTLFDYMFADMDYNLREMGVGDLGVGKRVRKMAEAFYGRARHYQAALEAEDQMALADALRRNLYGTVEKPDEEAVAAMVRYVVDSRDRLAEQPVDDLFAGKARFADPPVETPTAMEEGPG